LASQTGHDILLVVRFGGNFRGREGIVITLIWVLALAFPKAGMKFGEVPVTVASVVLMLYGAYNLIYPGYPARLQAESRRFMRYHLAFAWVLVLSLVVNLESLDTVDLTMWAVLVGSPLAFHAGLRAGNPKRLMLVVMVSTAAVGFYGLAQNLFGIVEIAVPGLTHVYGEDIIRDNPIRTAGGTLKSPSTFHNGNLAASFLLIGLGFSLFASRVDRRLRIVAMFALTGAVVGVAVSLARSAVFGFAIAAVIALMRKFRPTWVGSRVATLVSLVAIVAGFLLLGYILTGSTGFLIERYIIESIEDPSAAGRTSGYAAWLGTLAEASLGGLLQALTFGDWFVDPVADELEGLPLIIAKYGVFALVAMASIVVLPCRMIREALGSEGTIIWFGLVASASMWYIDNTFLFPPTLMNWFLLAGLAVQLSGEPSMRASNSGATPAGVMTLGKSTGH